MELSQDVGIRELKARLSEYVARAAEGQIVRVTDRGRPRAMLVPLAGRDRVRQGIEEGWITPGVAAADPPRRVRRVQAGPAGPSQVLQQDRGL